MAFTSKRQDIRFPPGLFGPVAMLEAPMFSQANTPPASSSVLASGPPASSVLANSRRLNPDRREKTPTGLSLVQVDPRLVVRGVRAAAGLLVKDVAPVGKVREMCPHCDTPLQLVLRDKDVIRSICTARNAPGVLMRVIRMDVLP